MLVPTIQYTTIVLWFAIVSKVRAHVRANFFVLRLLLSRCCDRRRRRRRRHCRCRRSRSQRRRYRRSNSFRLCDKTVGVAAHTCLSLHVQLFGTKAGISSPFFLSLSTSRSFSFSSFLHYIISIRNFVTVVVWYCIDIDTHTHTGTRIHGDVWSQPTETKRKENMIKQRKHTIQERNATHAWSNK